MDTVSVSKGIFVFQNGFKAKKSKGRKKSYNFQRSNYLSIELWYRSYSNLWQTLEKEIKNLNTQMFSIILRDLILYIKNSYLDEVYEIPTAVLLTGINMPDHEILFSSLSAELKLQVTPHVAILHAQDCSNLKCLVESLVNQLINGPSEDIDSDEDDDTTKVKKIVKKNQCSFSVLESWYETLGYTEMNRKVISLIFPEFESINPTVLQNFIQIASSYINVLPFALTFGVATSLSALNKSLPYHVSSKVNIQVFNSESSTNYLNNILENVFLTEKCPFHLGGALFALFMDIFLFYDFSVSGFMQNFKYAMLEHFSGGNQFALCGNKDDIEKYLRGFSSEELEGVRKSCLSFRKYVESNDARKQIKLLEDDDYYKEDLQERLIELTNYINKLHVFLKCIQILVEDLPKAPLGKQIRELYILVTSNDIISTAEFEESFKLLGFLSKDQLVLKIKNVCKVLAQPTDEKVVEYCKNVEQQLVFLLNKLETATDSVDEDFEFEDKPQTIDLKMDRMQLKNQLLQGTKNTNTKSLNNYEKCRGEILFYFKELFSLNLKNPRNFVYHELFFFDDLSIQSNIIGSHRAAIHTALNDPHSYLQCVCCKLNNDDSILNTMPDICIAYKLHLEYGKNINVYDWLQAFLSILDPISADDDEDGREVDPLLQARFTQSVAELEYLGFIKNSKRKTDHVTRLTWGG